jgi:cysteine desulfurase
MALDDVAVSSGSACTSARQAPSHVLRALGVGDDMAVASIRFSLGRFNTEAEVDHVIGRVARAIGRLRDISPLYTSRRQEAKSGSGR